MATRTTNLSLIKPDYEDAADIAVINVNMDTLDTEVNNLKKDNGLIDTKIAAHNVAADAHANRFANYLPLVGGTMTGEIGFDGTTKTLSVTGDDVTWGGKEIKSMAFPSSTSIEITSSFNANGATYTAPANGYINAQGATSGVNSTNAGYIMLTNSIGMKNFSGSDYTQLLHIYLPVKKGETVTLNFLRSVINKTLFIYAEGEV